MLSNCPKCPIDSPAIVCTRKIDPNQFVQIDVQEELELESDEEDDSPTCYYTAQVDNNIFSIEDRNYPEGLMDYYGITCQQKGQSDLIQGPGKCLCQKLKEGNSCDLCCQLEMDWRIYQVAEEQKGKIGEGKTVKLGNLKEDQHYQLHDLLTNNIDLFAQSLADLEQSNVEEHVIITEDVPPIKKRAYKTAPKENDFIKNEIDEMLEQDLIQPSTSPWSFPVVVVKKKNGKFRFCVNYKPLNDVTKKDNYPLPRINEILDSLKDAKWFTTLDLASGYWQIKVKEEHQEKTAFITKFGLFEFKVMPFGLCNAPATFQRIINKILGTSIEKYVMVYLDDVIIYSHTFEEHLKHLEEVLNRIHEANLRLKAEKCYFGANELQFLGHVVGEDGIKPDPEKVEKIRN